MQDPGTDSRHLARAHDSPGSKEGRANPRWRRLASPWARQHLREGGQAWARGESRLHLPALGRGRHLEAGLHRGPRGREDGENNRVCLPGKSLLQLTASPGYTGS